MKQNPHIKTTLSLLILLPILINLASCNHLLADAPLCINEFCASNSAVIADPQGQYDDWIEIYNYSEGPIDLAGMYLTDSFNNPTKWQFPSDNSNLTIIEPNGYLLIWADDDIGDSGLHTSFKLDADGEQIALFDTDGTSIIDGFTFGPQSTDITYGRYPDGALEFRYFSTPTPEAQNDGAYLGLVDDLDFSHKRGFYDDSFDLTITCPTPQVDIFYTTNGNAPVENDTPIAASIKYVSPISIESTTCIRAASLKTGYKTSNINTHTYIFNASEAIKSMPLLSIVGDEQKSLYEPDGIMAIVGGYYDGQGVWHSTGAGSYNNPVHRGIEYERPVSFEIIDPQTSADLQIDCGIRVHGSDYTRPRYTRGDDWLTCWNWWPNWNSNKFSFNLFFRGEYDNNWFEYPLFPFINVERFSSIVLRAGHNDACTPFIKDEWTRRLFLEMGAAQLTGTFANLYINGQYKAYYNPCGRLDEEFFQEWFSTDNSFDVIDQSGIRDGDRIAWNNLLNYTGAHDLADANEYEYVSSMVDVEEFIDYLILQIHIANFDWPNNNWCVYREKTEGAKFGFAIWDAEGVAETWIIDRGGWDVNAFDSMPYYETPGPGLNGGAWDICRLYRSLKANPDFRQLFADHVHKHYFNGGIMSETHLLDKWWEVFAEVSTVLPETSHHPVRFIPDEFLPRRGELMLDAYSQNNLFNHDVNAPTFYINNSYQHGGYVSTGDQLAMDSSSTGAIYYSLDGSDPRVSGASGPTKIIDRTFVAEEDAKRVLVPSSTVSDAWKGGSSFDDSTWISGTGGVGYDSGSDYEHLFDIDLESQMHNKRASCYIRIPFNVDATDLSDMDVLVLQMRYDDGFVAYINGIEVARKNFNGTPFWNSQASSQNPDEAAVFLENFDISDRVGAIQQGTNILAIQGLNLSTSSSDLLITPALVGGKINIEEIEITPTAIEYTVPVNLNHSAHVKARILSNGTWSALNEAVFAVGQIAQNLRITEIMYNPQNIGSPNDPNTEFIELQNIAAESINLNLVKFTNGVEFTFSNIELGPQQYILVVEDVNAFEAKYGSGKFIAGEYSGRLDNGGEKIELQDALNQTIHDFRYEDDWYPITDGQGYSLTIKNPTEADPNQWGNQDKWRPSAHFGGSPGQAD